MKTVILLNRGGGSAGEIERIEKVLAEAGLSAKPQWLDGGAIREAAEAAIAGGADLVVAGGGDGTINCVAGVVAGSGAALGILPLGTLNHFARDLEIPFDPAEAAKLIAAGKTRKVDIGEMNGRVFVNNSAIGLYPLMVVNRDLQQRRLGRSKRLAMVVAAARTLARFHHRRLTLTVNDRKAVVDTPLLFVGNNEYRLDFKAPGQRESVADGKLCVLVMRKKTRLGFFAAAVRALLGRTRDDDMVRLDDVTRLRVESRRSRLVVSLDGEVSHVEPPLEYRLRHLGLKVVAP